MQEWRTLLESEMTKLYLDGGLDIRIKKAMTDEEIRQTEALAARDTSRGMENIIAQVELYDQWQRGTEIDVQKWENISEVEKLQTDWPAPVHVHIFKDSLNLSGVKTMNLRHCKYLAQVGEALYDNSDQEPIGYEARFLDEPAVMGFADMVTDAVGKEHRVAVKEGMDGRDFTEGG